MTKSLSRTFPVQVNSPLTPLKHWITKLDKNLLAYTAETTMESDRLTNIRFHRLNTVTS